MGWPLAAETKSRWADERTETWPAMPHGASSLRRAPNWSREYVGLVAQRKMLAQIGERSTDQIERERYPRSNNTGDAPSVLRRDTDELRFMQVPSQECTSPHRAAAHSLRFWRSSR